ncbi:unnamed protein product [Caenorhabditis brenneri]
MEYCLGVGGIKKREGETDSQIIRIRKMGGPSAQYLRREQGAESLFSHRNVCKTLSTSVQTTFPTPTVTWSELFVFDLFSSSL